MKPDHAAMLRDQYEHFWTERLASFPDGWGDLLIEFFARLGKLNDFHARDRRSAWVKLDFLLYPGGGGMNIKATPLHSPSTSWTRPQREYLAQTLEWINVEIQKVCEVCGSPSEALFKTQMGEGRDRLLCKHHLAEAVIA
ncbi:hypothetical protein [Rhizobium sp. MHM7A]|uniref:hypothetical protein n=1 Tax=Rhizobium sp. MHM7A TaxID=2583233 RepID=UPI001106E737|nr:hypothetical protein [Rhizobium sp. MHM7A]TLX15928.1 hypothetical protein FFR93_01025 [Rhizobium sp. MHM7A]